MGIIPIVTPGQVLKALLKAGFLIIRQKGSHIRIQNPISGKSTTIAMHMKDMSRKMLSGILKQAGISIQDFLKHLKK